MARHHVYPVDLVQNLDQAMRPQAPGSFTSRPPVAIDLMIFRALLARPIIDPGEGKTDNETCPELEIPTPKTPARAH